MLFAAIGISLIVGFVTGSELVAILLGISLLLKPIVFRRVYSGTINNAWLFYTNEDGDYKGKCVTIRDALILLIIHLMLYTLTHKLVRIY